MAMTEHAGVRDFEKRATAAAFVGYNKKPEKGTAAERASKLRARFRKAVRSCADRIVSLSGTNNGQGSFQALRMGFEIAQAAPSGSEVLYASFDGGLVSTPFFWTPGSLARVSAALSEYGALLDEVEKLLKVEEVMRS